MWLRGARLYTREHQLCTVPVHSLSSLYLVIHTRLLFSLYSLHPYHNVHDQRLLFLSVSLCTELHGVRNQVITLIDTAVPVEIFSQQQTACAELITEFRTSTSGQSTEVIVVEYNSRAEANIILNTTQFGGSLVRLPAIIQAFQSASDASYQAALNFTMSGYEYTSNGSHYNSSSSNSWNMSYSRSTSTVRQGNITSALLLLQNIALANANTSFVAVNGSAVPNATNSSALQNTAHSTTFTTSAVFLGLTEFTSLTQVDIDHSKLLQQANIDISAVTVVNSSSTFSSNLVTTSTASFVSEPAEGHFLISESVSSALLNLQENFQSSECEKLIIH